MKAGLHIVRDSINYLMVAPPALDKPIEVAEFLWRRFVSCRMTEAFEDIRFEIRFHDDGAEVLFVPTKTASVFLNFYACTESARSIASGLALVLLFLSMGRLRR